MINKLRNRLNGDIHLKEVLTGSAVTFVLKISGMLLGYIVILIISRKYGAEGIGVYNLSFSILTFVAMIASLGMNVSILRYVGQFNKEGEKYKLKLLYRYAVELVVPFSIVLAIVLHLSAESIALHVFKNESYVPALKFIAFIVPFMALQNISVEFIRGLKKLKVSEFLRSVNPPIINIVLLFILSIFIVNQILPLYTLGIGIGVSAFLAFYYVFKNIKNISSHDDIIFEKKELISTSIPMMITFLASFFIGNIALFMLEIFSTTEDVGVFSVAYKIAMLISLVLIVVNTIAAPKFSELYWGKKYQELQSLIYSSSKLIVVCSLTISMFIVLFSKSLLGLFGSEFTIASYTLIILILGQMINATTGSVGILLNMTGNQKILRNIVLLAMIVSIIGNYILIPTYGINGAAVAIALGDFVLNIIAVIYVRLKLGFTTYYLPFISKGEKFHGH